MLCSRHAFPGAIQSYLVGIRLMDCMFCCIDSCCRLMAWMTFSCCRAASKAVRHLSYSLVPGRSPSVRHFWSSSSAVSCREAQPANTKPTAIISATLIGTPCSAVSASLSRH